MFLIVGLGNPGPDYADTRHNVGFMVLDRMAKEAGRPFKKDLVRQSLTCRVDRADCRVLLAKPQTFMNRSGLAVRELFEVFPLDPGRSLIVFDDVALPLGVIRIRASGSAGGQNGMKSVLQTLGTQDVPRLRIGIQYGELPDDRSDYVLGRFRAVEKKILQEVLDRSVEAIDTILAEGLDRAMSLFNQTK